MHLAVLMANTDESDFARRHPMDGEKFATLIHLVRPDWQVSSFSVKDGVFPADRSDFDGFIITGSPASVHDEAPWIPELLALIRDLETAKAPLFGACFGHQAIAAALGGRVERHPAGWSFGLVGMTVTQQPAWLPSEEMIWQYAAHNEHVTRLPEGANILFETAHCPVSGFAIGDHIYTTQNHPEMTPDFVAALIDELADDLGETVTQQACASMVRPADTAAFAESIARFFEQARSA